MAYTVKSLGQLDGLALAVAFFISGHGFAKFDKTLRQFLGISCLSKKNAIMMS